MLKNFQILLNDVVELNHDNTGLLNNIATSTIPIIDTTNAQDLKITVNTFVKMNHDNIGLFNIISKSTVPIINTLNVQERWSRSRWDTFGRFVTK